MPNVATSACGCRAAAARHSAVSSCRCSRNERISPQALQQMRHYRVRSSPAVNRGICVAQQPSEAMVERPARVALRVGLVVLVPITLGCARLAPELIVPPTHAAATQSVAASTELLPPRTFAPPREREDDEI